MNWFYFALGCLATFRLSLLISKEDGPAYIFRKIRKSPPKDSSFRDGLSCFLCVSVYMSAAVTVVMWWLGLIPIKESWLYGLSFSTVAILLHMKHTTEI